MPAIAREQENTPALLNWFTSVNGILTDMVKVEFQVWDISGGLPGSQVFPAVADTWEDVTTGGGHYSTGHYYCYDNANAKGWTPGIAEPLGTHRVKWRWKSSDSAPYQSDSEDFEVLVQSAGSSADTYIGVQDVRDAGLSQADYPDSDVLASIELWQQFLERACRQWFIPRIKVFSVDGNDSDTLHFGVPIVSIEYLKINDRTDELSPTLYRVYSGNDLPDNRKNPCIKLVGPSWNRDIFLAPIVSGQFRFLKGRQNQEIKGIFGYIEPDGSVPGLVKRALLKLVIEKLTCPPGGSASPTPPSVLGFVLEEKTDGHSIRYGSVGEFEKRKLAFSGITQDPEVLDIIKLYRAPIGIATPAHWSYF